MNCDSCGLTDGGLVFNPATFQRLAGAGYVDWQASGDSLTATGQYYVMFGADGLVIASHSPNPAATDFQKIGELSSNQLTNLKQWKDQVSSGGLVLTNTCSAGVQHPGGERRVRYNLYGSGTVITLEEGSIWSDCHQLQQQTTAASQAITALLENYLRGQSL